MRAAIILATLLALGVIEGIAYWWMHPKPAGLGQPVLAYRPSRSAGVSPADQQPGVGDHESEDRSQQEAPSSLNNPKSKIQNQQSLLLPPPTPLSPSSSPAPFHPCAAPPAAPRASTARTASSFMSPFSSGTSRLLTTFLKPSCTCPSNAWVPLG